MPPDHRTHASAAAGAVAGLTIGAYLLPALAGHWRPLRRPLGIEDRVAGAAAAAGARGAALTFDDGPHPQGTPAMLDVLRAHGAHATFFLVGEQVRRSPALAREIVACGHGIGLHCDRHRNLLRLAPGQVRSDIQRAQDTIESATGTGISLYRPPYGIANAASLAIARAHGWRTLLWSHWGRDWRASATPESICATVTAQLHDRAVLLLHDADEYSAPGSWRRTAAALPGVLEALASHDLATVAP